MHLVNKEQDLPLGFCNLVEHTLEAFLKLAAELRSRDKRPHVKRVECLVLQRLGYIPRHDAASKALDDRRLADARLTDEHGIVLRATRKDLNRAANLLVATDHRIELIRARRRCQIASIFLKRLIPLLRVIARDILLAVLLNCLLYSTLRQTKLTRNGLHLITSVRDDRK